LGLSQPWQPRMRYPYATGGKRILPKVEGKNLPYRALLRFYELDCRSKDWYLSRYEDHVGVIGFRVGDYMLAAKRKPYGYIVSFTDDMVRFAKERSLTLLLYIEESDAFYTFSPDVVLAVGEKNVFNGQFMLNLSVREGTRYEPR